MPLLFCLILGLHLCFFSGICYYIFKFISSFSDIYKLLLISFIVYSLFYLPDDGFIIFLKLGKHAEAVSTTSWPTYCFV
jgi:hypothetical protein